MTHRTPRTRRSLRSLRALAATVAVAAAGAVLAGPLPAAYAAAGVSVTSELGSATADAEYSTAIRVEGGGFQSIPGGMGGIYVLFGWVDQDGWRPSAGGVVGADYLYVPDSEAKDNQGFQRFVSFPGSETEAAAQTVMSADGSWGVDMTIPGSTFQAVDRDGAATSVDCLEVQCGIITIGAHGVKNANNETFTPITFTTPTAGAASGGESSGEEKEEPDTVAAIGTLSLGVDGTGAVAGNALPFTARGFAVGEQVVASLDGGAVAVGPLTAGNAGEVAGVLPLPPDLAAGTHLLTVHGAGTGGSVEAEITVAANPLAVAAASTDSGAPAWLLIVTVVAIALALALLVANVIVAIVRARRRGKARRLAAAVPEPAEVAPSAAEVPPAPTPRPDVPPPASVDADAVTERLPVGAHS
ncbi:MAG: hypothetical protein ACQEW8_11620 [Actinomycetota bacterium]